MSLSKTLSAIKPFVLKWIKDSIVETFPNTYYFHNDVADVATYEKLLGTPASGAEDADATALVAGDGEVLIGSYITYPTTGLGVAILRGGVWHFNIYCKVDNATVGTSQIVARVYKRASDTTETELFHCTGPRITTTAVALFDSQVIAPATVLAVTDRLVVKLYAVTTSSASRTITYYYEGTTHYSHIHTPDQIAGGSPVSVPVWIDWSPTLTGWSADPTDTVYRYLLNGNTCTLAIRQTTVGTSNSTEASLTLPFTAATIANHYWVGWGRGMDNSGILATPVMALIASNATSIVFYPSAAGSTWTASNNKGIYTMAITYEIA